MRKKLIVTLIVIFIILFIGIYRTLFQEGNPIPILKGITALNSNKDDFVIISNEPKRYITNAEDGRDIMIKFMEKDGWELVNQLGSGYVFSKDYDDLIVTSTKYTGRYTIWDVPIEE